MRSYFSHTLCLLREKFCNVVSQKSLERVTKEGDSPVGENNFTLLIVRPPLGGLILSTSRR